jgi:5,10-methylene-tetrahydrofolate dehydrogenase/methenyl tetrahydrofolate cyclohydrolase
MKARGEKVPHLAAVLVGNNGVSLTYVASKVKSCEQMSKMMKMMQGPGGKNLMKMMGNMKGMPSFPGMR